MMQSELLSIPMHSALNKPNLFMESDRELMMFFMLMELILVFQMLSLQSFLTAVVLAIFVIPLLRYMAKRDPWMRHIFIKQIKHQKFYPAHSTPYAELI